MLQRRVSRAYEHVFGGAGAGRARARGWAGDREGLGTHPPRFQGRAELRQRQRRFLLRADPGGRAGHPAQLRVRGEAPDHRLRGDRHRQPGEVAGPGPELRGAGFRHRGRRLGGRSADLPDAAQAALAGIPARIRPPAPAHQPVRRGDAHPPLPGAGGAPLLPRAPVLLDQHPDHHQQRRRRRRPDVPRLHPGHGQPAARRQGQRGFFPRLLRQGNLPHRVRPAQRRGLLPQP